MSPWQKCARCCTSTCSLLGRLASSSVARTGRDGCCSSGGSSTPRSMGHQMAKRAAQPPYQVNPMILNPRNNKRPTSSLTSKGGLPTTHS